MSFPQYPRYRDSGVEWLGEVPEHWDVSKTKRVVEFTTGWTPPTGDAASYDGDNLWANISDLGPRRLTDTAKRVSDEAARASGTRVSPKGSLLFSFKLSIGQVSFADRDMYTNEAIATFLPSPRLDLAFGYYALPLFLIQNAAENIYGAKLLNQELMRAADLLLPTSAEQRAIATFLDAQTSRIDALITGQQRLIELLKEKRQAVISRAVTKGMNPDAPMKDSGVEWIGDVPEHWFVTQLGKLCRAVSDGPHFSPPYVDDGIPFLSARNVKVDRWDFGDMKYVSPELCDEFDRRIIPEPGDVLYTKGGTTGIARTVDLSFRFQVWVHIAVLKLKRDIANPEYTAFALNSSGAYEQSQLYTRGATNQDLGLTRMIRILLALPPLNEQLEIVAYLHEELLAIDRDVRNVERAIALLQERRAALISAAVTGKIDVRGLMDVDTA